MTEQVVSTQKIIGIGPRLLKAVDRLAPLAGTVNGLLKPFMLKGGGSAAGAVSLVGSSIRSFKFASPLTTTMAVLNQPAVYPVQSGVGSWIGGMIAEQIGQELGGQVGGFLKTGGSAAMKFGVSSAFMGILSGYFLEQRGGGGPLGTVATGITGLVGGAGQNFRLAQDNPDIVPSTMTQGVVTPMQGTEY